MKISRIQLLAGIIALCLAPAGFAALLVDNGPLVTHPGAGSGGADVSALLDSSLGMGTFGWGAQTANGNRVADDFVIPAGQTWTITQLVFYSYQTGSTTTSTFTELNLRIWDMAPDEAFAATNVVFGDTTTNILSASSFTNIYRSLETDLTATNRPIMQLEAGVSVVLGAGTYWLDWQANGTLTSGPWAPPISIVGTTTTGNAMQYTSAWAAIVDGNQATAQGLPFQIHGTAIPEAQSAPLFLSLAGLGALLLFRRKDR